MKHIIEFNIPEDKEDLDIHLAAFKNHITVEEFYNKIFRPAYKHGYSTEYLDEKEAAELNRLVNSKNGSKMLDLLIKVYRGFMNERYD